MEIDCSISTFWQFGAETTFNRVMIFVQAAKMGGYNPLHACWESQSKEDHKVAQGGKLSMSLHYFIFFHSVTSCY